MKLLKENIQLNLHDLAVRNFLYMTPKIQATKENLNKSGFFQIKNISVSKDTIKREWTAFRDSTTKDVWDLEISWMQRVI